MFCPMCGDVLIDRAGGLICERGNMLLSPNLSQRLSECYEVESRSPQEKSFSFFIGGTWFCPGCRTQVVEKEKGILRCSSCGRWLNEFIYELIELSSHSKIEHNHS